MVGQAWAAWLTWDMVQTVTYALESFSKEGHQK